MVAQLAAVRVVRTLIGGCECQRLPRPGVSRGPGYCSGRHDRLIVDLAGWVAALNEVVGPARDHSRVIQDCGHGAAILPVVPAKSLARDPDRDGLAHPRRNHRLPDVSPPSCRPSIARSPLANSRRDRPPSYSGNSYADWEPSPESAETVIATGVIEPQLHQWFGSMQFAGHISNGIGIEAAEQGRSVWLAATD